MNLFADSQPFSWPGGARSAVSLSFDDARPSQVDRGLEVLDFYGVKATFYVQPAPLKERLDKWKGALAGGHEIGNHSVTHPCSGNFEWSRENALEDYTLERMDGEILEANRQVEALLGVVPRTFAYPCGQTFVGRGEGLRSYIPLVARRFLAGRGFKSEYLNAPGVCDLAQLGGTDLDGISSADAIARLDAAKSAGAWVVFAGHDIAPSGHQATKVATLEKLCEWLRDPKAGIWVATVAEVAEHILRYRVPGRA